MRAKLAAMSLAIASLLLLPSTAKADTFVYNVTTTFATVDVTFDEPTFEESVNTTTLIAGTSSVGPVTDFSLSGSSTGTCSASGPGGSVSPFSGPCLAGATSTGGLFSETSLSVPSFTGPGTSTLTADGFTTTVTITDVPSGVPEPSSLLLLGCGLFGLLAMASFRSRIRPFAGCRTPGVFRF